VGGIVAGKYRIGAVVGFSGMGIACAGMHLDLGTTVAVLFAHPEDASDERAVGRFLQGARWAAQLRSLHARRVLDCGRLPAGEPYMVLEALDGADLRSIVTTHGSLPVEETLSFVLQACEALGEAHARGLVHGDVRPENLFLTRGADGSGLVKVLGLEFATELGGTRDTRALSQSLDGAGACRHLSPEQMNDAT
jgi:serine/threonine-protein kinase